MTTSSPTGADSQLTQTQVNQAVKLFEFQPGKLVSVAALKSLLPNIEIALFFAKVYALDYAKLSELIRLLFRTDVVEALLGEGHEHSTELQDYIIDTVPPDVRAEHGNGHYDEDIEPPDSELLGALIEQATTQVAQSIQDVADKLADVLEAMPSKYGTMTFEHMHKLNVQRGSIGTYQAQIVHPPTPPRLVVLDVSGSMTETTIRRIVNEVVALAYQVNASLAIVSNDAFLWEAGTFDVDTVLRHAQYGGTFYERLLPIFHDNWETVITIADYDSARTAKQFLRNHARGRVRQVFDISLVNKPTFLAECVGQIADEVHPLLIGNSQYVLSH